MSKSEKKRFDHLETKGSDTSWKYSIFRRMTFKRKLEIDGVEREAIQVEDRVELEDTSQRVDFDEIRKVAREARENAKLTDQDRERIAAQERERTLRQIRNANHKKVMIFVLAVISINFALHALSTQKGQSVTLNKMIRYVFVILAVLGFGRFRKRWW